MDKKRKEINIVLLIIIILSLVIYQAKGKTKPIQVSYVVNDEDFAIVEEGFRENDLDNFDIIARRIKDFNSTNQANLHQGFKNIKEIEYDRFAFNDDFTKNTPSKFDTNCRQTTALALLNNIDVKKSEMKGTYLVFDWEELAENPDLTAIGQGKYYGLYNEVSLDGSRLENIEEKLQEELDTRNIKNTNEKIRLVQVYIHDASSECVFVGHSGIIFDQGGDSYFFEKLATNEPYQLSRFSDIKDLITMLEDRYDFEEEDTHKPIGTIDGKLAQK